MQIFKQELDLELNGTQDFAIGISIFDQKSDCFHIRSVCGSRTDGLGTLRQPYYVDQGMSEYSRHTVKRAARNGQPKEKLYNRRLANRPHVIQVRSVIRQRWRLCKTFLHLHYDLHPFHKVNRSLISLAGWYIAVEASMPCHRYRVLATPTLASVEPFCKCL